MRIYIKFIIILTVFFNNPLYSQDYEVGDLIKFKSSIAIKGKENATSIISKTDSILNRLHANVYFTIEDINDSIVIVTAIPFNEKVTKSKEQYYKDSIGDKSVIVKKKGGVIQKVYHNPDLDKNKSILEKADANELKKKDKTSYASLYNGEIFKVYKDKFNKAYEKVTPFERVTLGVLSLPIKLRPQGKVSFDTHFNIGATVGYRLNKNKLKSSAIYAQLGLNIGSTQLNSSNSTIGDEEEINTTLATVITGLMFQYKKIQVGFYSGLDFISNQKEYEWDYHSKPWLSLGIGIDLFQPKDVQVNGQ